VAAWLNMVVIWKQPGHFTSCADMCVCVCMCVSVYLRKWSCVFVCACVFA
jgi:hypothetical protein